MAAGNGGSERRGVTGVEAPLVAPQYRRHFAEIRIDIAKFALTRPLVSGRAGE